MAHELATTSVFNEIVQDVEAEPITKARAKFLFKKYCAADVANEFHVAYGGASDAGDRYRHLAQHAAQVELERDEHRQKYREINELFALVDPACAAVTSMVALWRTLEKAESRASVAERTILNLSTLPCPGPLMSLLEGCTQGQPAFVVA